MLFEACATGKPEPTVEWFYGKTKLVASERIIMQKDGDKYTLQIKKAVIKEAGLYSVKATNDQGTLSADAKLKVNSESSLSFIVISFSNNLEGLKI